MVRVLIAYGTTEGQTAKIAEAMAGALREGGHDVDVRDSASLEAWSVPETYAGVLVGGSVHGGEHQRGLRDFVRRNREALDRVPSLFFSVSLAAGDDDAEAREQARGYIETFVRETGWTPDRAEAIAGALAYSHYGFLIRRIMKLIAKQHGLPTDVSHDYEYTDWPSVEAFAREFGTSLAPEES